MDEGTPWRNLGTIGLRLLDLTVRYCLTFAITWAVATAALPADTDVPGTGLELFPFIGVPSILISSVYAVASTRTGMAFRLPLAGLLLLPTWLLLFQNFMALLVIPVLGQLLFALCVMRAPMPGPSRLRRRAAVALAALAALTGCGPYTYVETPTLDGITTAEAVGAWRCIEGTELILRTDGSAAITLLDGQDFDFDDGWRLSGTGNWKLTDNPAGGQRLRVTLTSRTASAVRQDAEVAGTLQEGPGPAPETYTWTFYMRRDTHRELQLYFLFGDPDSGSTYVMERKRAGAGTGAGEPTSSLPGRPGG
ncbi:hypothetical protein [Streptomyces sp. NPDC058620]|uniref:hypothetical protein n=1 Tax=Streptomyces sp. NPDC058620 TaxID=3346560 RepID=UPI00364A3057